MADDFKRKSMQHIGIGGMDCNCCGIAPGKDRKIHRRTTRRRLKQEIRKNLQKDNTDGSCENRLQEAQ